MGWTQRMRTGLSRAVKGLRVARTGDAATAQPSPSWVARAQSLQWVGGDLVLTGWALDRGLDYTGRRPQLEVRLGDVTGDVVTVPSAEPNLRSNGCESPSDFSSTAFAATFQGSSLRTLTAGEHQLRVAVGTGDERREGRFTEFNEASSAAFPPAAPVADRWFEPQWTNQRGLSIRVRADAVRVVDVEVVDQAVRLAFDAQVDGVQVDGGGATCSMRGSALLVRPEAVERPVTPKAVGRWEERGAALTDRQPFGISALRASGRPVVVAAGDEALLSVAGRALALESGPGGQARVVTARSLAVLDVVRLEADEHTAVLQVEGRLAGEPSAVRLDLVGRRDVLSGPVTLVAPDRWRAEVSLLVSRWGQAPLPTATGGYRVRLVAADGTAIRVTWPAVRLGAPSAEWSSWFRLSSEVGPGRTALVRINRPLRDSELGTYNQSLLEQRYAAGGFGVQDAVYLESFYERIATCNPRALDRVLDAEHPELPRYWGVKDRSVAVPDGAVPVVDGSEEWWRARASCRWVITNDWLRARFVHQPHQVVLQTWHGTMFKRIGLDLARTQGELVDKFLHEQSLWDLLLSQNPHSTQVFRSAYAWDREFVEEGYPRNDLLIGGDGLPIRMRLGIRPEQKVLLYAPTWRDNTDAFVSYLDADRLAADLGEEYVVLLRAHSRTLRGENAEVGAGVIDVTSYPDIGELFLASDAVITDYSSIMFDFAVTGRPIIFFVPDLAEYRDELRGVYFDLEPVAPGPVVQTQDAVLAAVRSMEADRDRYAERYAQWQHRFVPWDDGNSGRRVLARLFATAPRAAT